MHGLIPQYQGQLDFVIVDIDRPAEDQYEYLYSIDSQYVPAFGFFDRHGEMVYMIDGWNEREFNRQVERLVGG